MYRKFSAEYIFNGYEFLHGQVLITDNTGIIVEIIDESEFSDGVEKFNGLLCPGFINAHCHLELSHMKGRIPKHTGLVDFVLKVINERHFDEDEILVSIENADYEMLQNGIVAVGDICNHTLTISQKSKSRLLYHNFIEASGFPPSVARQRFTKAVDIYNSYAENILTNSIVPHAPYSVSPEMFKMINDLGSNNLITIHNQETATENDLFENGTGDLLRLYQQMGIDISFFKPSGRSSLQTWLPHYTKEQTIILVHNVGTSEEDLSFMNRIPENDKGSTFFCLCPNANLYISNKLPNVNMLMRYSDNIVLGTDSLASNGQLSILEELKTLQIKCKGLTLATLLQWSTSNGSRALKMENKLGSFEKGKKPGINLIEGAEDFKICTNTSVKRIL